VQVAGYLAVRVAGEPRPPRHPPHPPPLLQAEAHPPRPALTRQYTQILINKQADFIICMYSMNNRLQLDGIHQQKDAK
jgi:hypothetical protein